MLTKKMVRKRYQSHFKKDSVSPEERQKINEVLDVILEELARGNKVDILKLSPTKHKVMTCL